MGQKDVEMTEKQRNLQRIMRATKEISELPKTSDWRFNPEYMTALVDRILSICDRTGTLPTVSLLTTALSIPREMESDVRTGVLSCDPKVREEMVRYFHICETMVMQGALSGDVNNITSIFMLKSVFSYKEEPREVVVTHNKLLGERKDAKAIAERYLDAMVLPERSDSDDECERLGDDTVEASGD